MTSENSLRENQNPQQLFFPHRENLQKFFFLGSVTSPSQPLDDVYSIYRVYGIYRVYVSSRSSIPSVRNHPSLLHPNHKMLIQPPYNPGFSAHFLISTTTSCVLKNRKTVEMDPTEIGRGGGAGGGDCPHPCPDGLARARTIARRAGTSAGLRVSECSHTRVLPCGCACRLHVRAGDDPPRLHPAGRAAAPS